MIAAAMLITFVVLYLLVTIGIGLWAARRVHNSKDYVVAGRSLPLYMTAATVFATWFGAETVLSVSATFTKDGLGGIVADPFGSSFCLVFVALFFARAFYRMDLLTIGDFYRKRYNKPVEVVDQRRHHGFVPGLDLGAAHRARPGVLGALGRGDRRSTPGILIGAAIVLVYTIWGGMWSVAMTDLFQSVVILVGLVRDRLAGERHGGRRRQGDRGRGRGRQVRVLAQGRRPRSGLRSSPRG